MEAYGWFLAEACFDGEHVESPPRIFQVASAKKLPRHAREVAPLLVIYGVFRPRLAQLGGNARFYFDKCEHRAVVCDHIEFTFHTRHSEIARDHYVTMATEIPIGISFAANSRVACTLLCGSFHARFRQTLTGGKIQNGIHELRKQPEPSPFTR